MPRIDPQQLLTCLHVLLSHDGGILSMNEVSRLANLMTKFSKKLVSKCIYILILKNTNPDLLFAFMGVGGWDLIQIWLQDGIQNKNWALVTELLELLLLTPVDVDRLKSNNLPKIVKGLTKREDLQGIQHLSTRLVQQWLKIVKEVTKKECVKSECEDKENTERVTEQPNGAVTDSTVNSVDIAVNSSLVNSDANTYTTDNGYRIVLKDGKQIYCKLVDNDIDDGVSVDSVNKHVINEMEQSKRSGANSASSKHKSSSKSSSRDKDRSNSSSSSSKSKDRDKSCSSSSKSKSSSSGSSGSSRDKDRRNSSSHSSSSSKHRSSSSSSSSSNTKSSSSKDRRDSKEKQADKDKDTLAKIQPPSLSKVGRIPKKSDSKREDDSKTILKPSFSVEVRKSSEEKPKTVKVFNSKMRSTGLLDEAKPPPPRNATKKQTNSPQSLKRSASASSPPGDGNNGGTPPEKKPRQIDPESTKAERPGSIKLIPPKPKPAFLQESDIFMDALAASATKSPKKRKRKLSISKESPTAPAVVKAIITSPTSLKSITPANFYQDTLQSELSDDIDADKKIDEDGVITEEEISKQSPEELSSDETVTTRTDINGLKGVLSYSKRSGPKKSIRWKPESELVDIQYFELDETERINVTKTFMDMARMEMSGEREALIKSRKLINDDIMDAQTAWRTLHEIDLPEALVVPGFKSIEKDIQFAREKIVSQAVYFSMFAVPDAAAEPDPETHQMSDPVPIPLEDGDHADDALPVHSWPEPKGSPPHQVTHPPLNIFNNNNQGTGMAPSNYPPSGGPMLHPGMVPPFGPDNFMPPPPVMMGGTSAGVEWANDPLMMGPPVQNGMFNNGPPPNFLSNKGLMQPPPPQFGNGPMNGPGPGFPPSGPPGGFPGPPGRGRGGHFNNMMRGGRGGSGWVRMSGNNNPQQWNRLNGPPIGAPGGGAKRGRFCNNVKNHGFCRNRDTCPFMHPN